MTIIKKIDQTVHKHLLLAGLLFLLVFLRIPNFFEPYWYGDEAIYLTVGTALRHGERLYAEIIDHKTPIIYYLAMVPNQLYFRILNVATMLLTTTLMYFFMTKIIKNKAAVFVSTLVFVLLTTLPWFEGHIPNGELFVMCFVSIGVTFFARTRIFQQFMNEQKKTSAASPLRDLILLFVTGIFFSLGILTKVPAVFDAMAFLFIFWLVFTDTFFQRSTQKISALVHVITSGVAVLAGIIAPVALSIIYFVIRGSGQAYLDYGLLYNFHYIGSSVPSFAFPWIGTFFLLPVKAVLLVLLLIGLTIGLRIFTRRFRFIAGWFGLALFATLLSNRAYPHYYLQMISPLVLLIGYLIEELSTFIENRKVNLPKISEVVLSGILLSLFVGVMLLLHVGLYSTTEYYTKFFKLLTHQISWEQYRDSFNGLDADNYKANEILKASSDERMFIWGTNPMLYALSGKSPTGRFTVAFHIFDFHAEQESLLDVKKHSPEYIVIMKEEKSFPDLEKYVNQYYRPNSQFRYFTLWKRN